MLVGRSAERKTLEDLLVRATDGHSGALVLRGEAGVGKTVLLDETLAAARAAGMQTARLTGIEPETQLGYGGLHRFLFPYADRLERLPAPQREALRNTLGLTAGPPADRFLVALSVLTLLADVASESPLVCIIDDAQWLDPETVVVLGFVARRLYAERMVLLFAVRDPDSQLPALTGLPELMIGGLDNDAALALLSSLAPGPVSPAVAARIVADTGGNPLALAELASELSQAQLAGTQPLPELLPAGASLQTVFSSRVNRLPPDTRLLLAVAAAEPAGSQDLLWRAARQLGIDPDTAAADDLGGLAEIGRQVEFRHPLIRSAIYQAIPSPQRRQIHQALAAAGETADRPDRVAWHLGMAAIGPDEAVASRLEEAASSAQERGGYAAAVTFWSRAADLSADAGARARRQLAAAEGALIAGQPARASALLAEATPWLDDPRARAQATRLRGTIGFALGRPAGSSTILLEAARALAPVDVQGAREALLQAVEAVVYAGWSANREVLLEIAAVARTLPGGDGPTASATELLLDGFAIRASDYPAAVPLFRRAIALLQADDLSPQEGLRGLGLGCMAAADLWDDQAQSALAVRWVRLARDLGALTVLPLALHYQSGFAQVLAGRFDASAACRAERAEIALATGNPGHAGTTGIAPVIELAWRGREDDTRRAAAALAREAAKAGRGAQTIWIQRSLSVLELGLGNYKAALQYALDVYADDAPYFGTQVLPDLIEAAARCDRADVADSTLGRLSERALTAGTPLALGLLARSQALLASDDSAERLYEEAIRHLQQCDTAPQLARSYLMYGEWLRHQQRGREARTQLRVAYEMFDSMGAEAFAERARADLVATGGCVRQRVSDTRAELTQQEARIAGLVSQGYSNRDIAAQLFLSPSTVDYHLRKVFRKVGVTSRTQLARTMPPDELHQVCFDQGLSKTDPPVDPELPVDGAQVVLDGGGAEEQLGGNVTIRGPARGQLGDLELLRSELDVSRIGAGMRVFAGGRQLGAGPVGEAVHAHPLEAFQRGTELVPGIAATPLAAEPFSVDQLRACYRESDGSSLKVVDRLLITVGGRRVITREQCPAACRHAKGPGCASRRCQRGKIIEGGLGDRGLAAAHGSLDHVFR
jgi:DNA-binding CsgD family transcriptional regulator